MSTQPTALRLADCMEEMDAIFSFPGTCGEAAAELRRLHTLNQELLEPLLAWEKAYCDKDFSLTMRQFDMMVRAAIAKAGE